MNLIRHVAAIVGLVFSCCCFAAFEPVINTTVCEVASNPPAFDHKLVRLSGDVTHGYKLFTLADTCKQNLSSIWLTYGGLISPPSIFNAEQSDVPRVQPLAIEGIETTLANDEEFKKFDKLVATMADRPQTRATLIGRYFAGHPEQVGEFKLWKGFGPMNCCTLLVVQQVVDAKSTDHQGKKK